MQELSSWVSLTKDAWDEAKSNGVAMELKKELRTRKKNIGEMVRYDRF